MITHNLDELEKTFERWEVRITQDEILSESAEPVDSLEQSFQGQEEEQALRAELEALLNGEDGNEH